MRKCKVGYKDKVYCVIPSWDNRTSAELRLPNLTYWVGGNARIALFKQLIFKRL